MKMTKKINSFIALMLFTTTFNSYSMEPQQPSKWTIIVGGVLLGTLAIQMLWRSQPGESFPFGDLPPEMQDKIIQLLSLGATASSLNEAAKIVNSLAQVNHELNELINDPQFCLKIIKHFAQKFNCSDTVVAEAIQTTEAKRQLALQKKLYQIVDLNVSENEALDAIQNLVEQGIDLNFTYTYFSSKTSDPLMPLMSFLLRPDIITILIQHGANINQCNMHGNTVLLLVLKSTNPNFMPIIVKTLLADGADPELANFAGLTPLAAAQKTGNQRIIDLIQDAIDKKHEKK